MADDAPIAPRRRGFRRKSTPMAPSSGPANTAGTTADDSPRPEPQERTQVAAPDPEPAAPTEPSKSGPRPAGGAPSSVAAAAGAVAGTAMSAPADESALRLASGAKPTATSLPRRRFINDMPDRGLFIAWVLVGFVGIFVFKLQGVPAWIVASLAVAAMVVYGVFAYNVPAVRLRPDRLGDNFYYMGFIYTLASMSAALVQLDVLHSALDALIGSFGIALFTTIAGIAGRVVFVQMREDIDDTEERARRDILEAYMKLKDSMGAAVVEFEAFRMGVQNVLHERLRSSLDRFATAADAQVSRVGAAAESVIESVQRASTASFDHAQTLTKAAQQTAETAERLYREIEAIKVPPDIMERKLDAVVSRIEAAATAFARTSEQDLARQQTLGALGESVRNLVESLKDDLPKLQHTVSAVAAVAEPAKSLSASLDAMRASMAALAQSIADHNAASAVAGRMAHETQQQMAADLQKSRAAVLEVQQAIAETARVVVEHLGRGPELR